MACVESFKRINTYETLNNKYMANLHSPSWHIEAFMKHIKFTYKNNMQQKTTTCVVRCSTFRILATGTYLLKQCNYSVSALSRNPISVRHTYSHVQWVRGRRHFSFGGALHIKRCKVAHVQYIMQKWLSQDNYAWWKKFDYIFQFSIKNWTRISIQFPCEKIMFTSVMTIITCMHFDRWEK